MAKCEVRYCWLYSTWSQGITQADVSKRRRYSQSIVRMEIVVHDHVIKWRQTFSAILALCAGNSPFTGEFPAQRPVTRSFGVFFNLRLNKGLSKQSRGWWFETSCYSLWRHFNVKRHHVTMKGFCQLIFVAGFNIITCISTIWNSIITDITTFKLNFFIVFITFYFAVLCLLQNVIWSLKSTTVPSNLLAKHPAQKHSN